MKTPSARRGFALHVARGRELRASADDIGVSLCQPYSHGPPDAAPRAGDERRLTLNSEFVEGSSR